MVLSKTVQLSSCQHSRLVYLTRVELSVKHPVLQLFQYIPIIWNGAKFWQFLGTYNCNMYQKPLSFILHVYCLSCEVIQRSSGGPHWRFGNQMCSLIYATFLVLFNFIHELNKLPWYGRVEHKPTDLKGCGYESHENYALFLPFPGRKLWKSFKILEMEDSCFLCDYYFLDIKSLFSGF